MKVLVALSDLCKEFIILNIRSLENLNQSFSELWGCCGTNVSPSLLLMSYNRFALISRFYKVWHIISYNTRWKNKDILNVFYNQFIIFTVSKLYKKGVVSCYFSNEKLLSL
jgi:hypothetical protein